MGKESMLTPVSIGGWGEEGGEEVKLEEMRG